jgi:beta-glucosidase
MAMADERASPSLLRRTTAARSMMRCLLSLQLLATTATATAAAAPVTQRPWMVDVSEPPRARAEKLVAAMTLPEQLALLHGSCHEWPRPPGVLGYTGRICANKRLGIPEMRLNDGPVGFRCDSCAGSTTSWPSSITLAAGFDRAQTKQWGAAMGREWYGKGANNQLGPGLSLARLPNNGRLWEYLSGEDPYLGYHMGAAVTEGIQGQGVVATAKHFIDNSQETARGAVIEVVDERTQFEMYYPPFEGAISAGLGGVMCSFNRECVGCANPSTDAKHSCENHDTLQRDLKGRLGFQGLVMSDWDATHSTGSINAGLDLEMPAGQWLNQSQLGAFLAAGNTTKQTIAESATRILWGLFQTGLMDRPNTNGSIYRNVSTPQHIALARQLAAASAVLLQNKDQILPLRVAAVGDDKGSGGGDDTAASSSAAAAPAGAVVREIAVIGVQAVDPIYHGGCPGPDCSPSSGQVKAGYVPTPLDSLREALGIPKGKECTAATETGRTTTAAASNGSSTTHSWQRKPSVCVRYNSGAVVAEAVKLAAAADVSIVFVGCTGSEGRDRANLTLGVGQDHLIQAVATATTATATAASSHRGNGYGNNSSGSSSTVVVAVSPGPILTPWRKSVAAILAMFMPGQEYGHAIADLLLGKAYPSGCVRAHEREAQLNCLTVLLACLWSWSIHTHTLTHLLAFITHAHMYVCVCARMYMPAVAGSCQ